MTFRLSQKPLRLAALLGLTTFTATLAVVSSAAAQGDSRVQVTSNGVPVSMPSFGSSSGHDRIVSTMDKKDMFMWAKTEAQGYRERVQRGEVKGKLVGGQPWWMKPSPNKNQPKGRTQVASRRPRGSAQRGWWTGQPQRYGAALQQRHRKIYGATAFTSYFFDN